MANKSMKSLAEPQQEMAQRWAERRPVPGEQELPNFCPQNFWQLSHYARKALHRMRQRSKFGDCLLGTGRNVLIDAPV